MTCMTLLLSLVYTLQKPTPESGAINSTPASGARFSCRLHLARKKLAPIYGVEIDNGRRPRRSSFHPIMIITKFDTRQKSIRNFAVVRVTINFWSIWWKLHDSIAHGWKMWCSKLCAFVILLYTVAKWRCNKLSAFFSGPLCICCCRPRMSVGKETSRQQLQTTAHSSF